MGKFRKIPVVIEAMKWDGKNHREMYDFLEYPPEEALVHSIDSIGKNFYMDFNKIEGGLVIKTLEGEHLASIGDWIIKGVAGEFYPVKNDIFKQTYEIVKEA